MKTTVSNIVQELPFDILDHIITLIVNPQDLLSLALICQRFASFVVPYHLRQGRVLCNPLRLSLWKTLSMQPGPLMKVRSFELVWEGDEPTAPVIPPSLGDCMDCDAFDEEIARNLANYNVIKLNVNMISSIIQRMPLLFRFRWQTRVAPPERLCAQLFTSLGSSCPHLKEMILNASVTSMRKVDPLTFYDLGPMNQPTYHTLALTLTRFMLRAIGPGQATVNMIVDRLITHCPALIDISIALPFFAKHRNPRTHMVIPRVYVPRFFRDGNWPNLTRLALFGASLAFHGSTVTDPYENEAVNGFWERHSKLKSLILDPNTTTPHFTLPPGETSSLKNLYISYSALESFNLTLEVAQNIVCFQLGGKIYELDATASLLNTMRSLRSLTLEYWPEDSLTILVYAIPHVERLRLRAQFIHWRNDRAIPFHNFSTLTRLTHLGGLLERLPRSTKHLPPIKSLRYISVVGDFDDIDDVTWLELERDEKGHLIGWSLTDDVTSWPPSNSDKDKYFLQHLPDQYRPFI